MVLLLRVRTVISKAVILTEIPESVDAGVTGWLTAVIHDHSTALGTLPC